MKGKRLLKEIRLSCLLSYGPEVAILQLEPLNVLIGPNASGKSNLISALRLLSSAPKGLTEFLREEGGTQEWIWKGLEGSLSAGIGVNLDSSRAYLIRFSYRLAGPYVETESLWGEAGDLLYNLSQSLLMTRGQEMVDQSIFAEILKNQSVLSQIKDPQSYPDLTLLGVQFGRFRFFRDWNLGRGSAVRRPQAADLPSDFLLEDVSNLGLVLSDFTNNYPKIKRLIVEKLQLLYERVEDLTTHVQGGTVQVFFHEKGLSRPIPASRVSDGTLLFLCLLTILLHPSPPPLICIEEPEIGLHPDAIQALAELLIDAASRTQLIVTTHSDVLVSALSEVPEAIIVCERGEGGTTLNRLEPDKLAEWLERYRLGELWRMGQIGGNRW